MRYFHISDHERELYLVVEICPSGCGWIIATSRDPNNARQIAELLNEDLAARIAKAEASVVDPPPCPPAPENENPETEQAKRGGR